MAVGPVYTSHAMELDHVVVLVDDLDAAVREWRAAGFTITPGGVHADGLTHNALICFADGSYVELLAFRTTTATAHRWEHFRAFPGLIDYAVAVGDLPAFVSHSQARGLGYSAVVEGGRQRPDGVTIRWRTSWPPPGSEGLPFLIEDLTPRELRVPAGNNRTHANGARGIAVLTCAVHDLDRAMSDLSILFGAPGESDVESKVFTAGNSALHVRRLSESEGMIAQRGPGPVSLTITLGDGKTWLLPQGR